MTARPSLVLVGGDLNALARVDAAASAAGLALLRTTVDRLGEPTDPPAALVLVDLDEVGSGAVQTLSDAVERASIERARVVLFYSHIDEVAAAAARAAGFRAVPRGRFWRELPQLVSDLEV